MREPAGGLFVVGTDTGVGKTYVAAMMARALVAAGRRVGVYKPAASGCRREGGELISDDAVALWRAAGSPESLARVCPQCFAAPLAPPLAAAAEGKKVDSRLLREGLQWWIERSDVVLVEGAGGLLSPISDDELVADLAAAFGFPLVVVARNALGVINQVLQTVHVARSYRGGLHVAAVVLNQPAPPDDDPSVASNRAELARRLAPLGGEPPQLAEVACQADGSDPPIDWLALARPGADLPAGERRWGTRY
jgi:dethiobiotin synthetase